MCSWKKIKGDRWWSSPAIARVKSSEASVWNIFCSTAEKRVANRASTFTESLVEEWLSLNTYILVPFHDRYTFPVQLEKNRQLFDSKKSLFLLDAYVQNTKLMKTAIAALYVRCVRCQMLSIIFSKFVQPRRNWKMT